MDPITRSFLLEALAYIAGAIICAALGWAACRFRHRFDVRRAVDAAHRRIEERHRRFFQDL